MHCVHCRTLNNLKTLQSPVFLSTAEDGRVQQGCGGIPLDRPLLLVSNHQTYALDIGPLIEGLLRQTGLLPRGLTHPAVFQVCLLGPPRHSPLWLIAITDLCARPVDSQRSRWCVPDATQVPVFAVIGVVTSLTVMQVLTLQVCRFAALYLVSHASGRKWKA